MQSDNCMEEIGIMRCNKIAKKIFPFLQYLLHITIGDYMMQSKNCILQIGLKGCNLWIVWNRLGIMRCDEIVKKGLPPMQYLLHIASGVRGYNPRIAWNGLGIMRYDKIAKKGLPLMQCLL